LLTSCLGDGEMSDGQWVEGPWICADSCHAGRA
jgi:hypothetical protein